MLGNQMLNGVHQLGVMNLTMLEKDRIPFCFVTEDGDWHESASMGWWAMTTNDEDVWNKEFKEYLDSV